MKEATDSESFPRASGVIVAGGQSRRMGRDKAFIDFNGKPIIERVIEQVQAVCSEIIIVANNQDTFARFGLPVIGDAYPGKGSLGGVFTGLQAAREPYALAVGCDMPFLNVRLLRHLISLAPGYDIVLPHAPDSPFQTLRPRRNLGNEFKDKPIAKERGLHPLHAVYAKSCLDSMQARIQADDLRLIGFFETLNVRVVEADEIDQFDPSHLSFCNVNTPDDLQVALNLGR